MFSVHLSKKTDSKERLAVTDNLKLHIMKLNFHSNHALSNKELLELIHEKLEGLIVLAETQGLKQEVYLLDQCQMDLLKLRGEY